MAEMVCACACSFVHRGPTSGRFRVQYYAAAKRSVSMHVCHGCTFALCWARFGFGVEAHSLAAFSYLYNLGVHRFIVHVGLRSILSLFNLTESAV